MCNSLFLYRYLPLASEMKKRHIIFYWLLFFGMPDLFAQKITAEKYIDTYKNLAVSEMHRSGIPASITLAQGILESSSGNSRLATVANNHFGIKCHDWAGKKIYHDDNRQGECFRHYESANESYLDHTDFLMTRSRYAFLFEYKPTDYKNWAKGLSKAGYATNPQYPQLLIGLIERYDLQQYDTGVAVSEKTPDKRASKPATKVRPRSKAGSPADEFSISISKYTVMENNRTDYILAKEGDTYASLTGKLDMMPWQLPRYNDADASETLSEGRIVYLQPKRRKAERGKEVHVVQDGETMHGISQIYGIRLHRLYVLNRMEPGAQPKVNEKLNLRRKK